MYKHIQIIVDPDHIDDKNYIRNKISNEAGAPCFDYRIIRRSIDARKQHVKFILQVELLLDETDSFHSGTKPEYKHVDHCSPVLIVGAGPAGYFAALELIESGIKPVVLERGKDVHSRKSTIQELFRNGAVSRNSNYCFGEGGAGTYSDGKLYTRSTGRADVNKIFDILISHGAPDDIKIDSRPHIGSDKLPDIVQNIRTTILSYGGEILFDSRVTDLILSKNRILGVHLENGQEVSGEAVILASGHSGREIYELLHAKQILVQPKPFAMGVRVEHPQVLIDSIQYHRAPRHEKLPPASYQLVSQVDGRGVFSFCMCPGGFIVPTSTSPGELVVNGMSLFDRSSPYANSGIVVSIGLEDIEKEYPDGALSLLSFQRAMEKKAFEFGGSRNLCAPAQRLTDFVSGKTSSTLPNTSYAPGVFAAPIHNLFPLVIHDRLRKAFVEFDKKMKGYYTEEAIILAVESRTSSPVRIPRDSATLMHPQIQNLYPCGEGAGYAGGIVSSAMDGQRMAKKIASCLK
ncbi:MAG: FAD-dependent oxidoreductase [Desulfobacterales bacterium]